MPRKAAHTATEVKKSTVGARNTAKHRNAARASAKSGANQKAAKRSSPESASTPKVSTKQQTILDLLGQPEGTTVAAIMQATGWQQHSVRGFFAGTVRKKLGLALVSEKVDDQRVYRLLDEKPARSRSAAPAPTASAS